MRDTREDAYRMFEGKASIRSMCLSLDIGMSQAKRYVSEFKHSKELLKQTVKDNPLTYIRMVENELFQLYAWKNSNEPYNADRMRSLEVIYSNYKLK